MERYVLNFNEIDRSDLPRVGGKGANLGEMTKAGLPVPPGFCVTTGAYRSFIQTSWQLDELFERLEQVRYDDLEQIRLLGQQIRAHLARVAMPSAVQSAIEQAWERAGKDRAYAVRSSATAEDLPSASFAGQQDTYLNVRGLQPLLHAVQQCWASLFTDRAISYRARNGFDHRSVWLSVVVQQMVFPQVAGILFTADPITGHRATVSIDASFGLGEALVSGIVTADLYQVQAGRIVKKQIAKKELAVYSAPEGGTITLPIPPDRQHAQALTDEQILLLAGLGKQIEQHYGSEQDIEWGYADGTFYVLQSRPITSLYPLPSAPDDRFRVYLNFGYIQMMTDPMKPLAISLLSYIPNFIKKDPASPENPFIREAGGRAFADITGLLAFRPVRHRLLKVMKGMDELMASAMSEVVQREAFRSVHIPKRNIFQAMRKIAPIVIPVAGKVLGQLLYKDPRKARAAAEALIDELVTNTERTMAEASGADRIRLIRLAMGTMLPQVISKVVVFLIAGVIASMTLDRALKRKVGAARGGTLLNQLYKSLPGNVTTEIGQDMGDLADKIRDNPEVIAYLQQATPEHFYAGLQELPGGREFIGELEHFLEKYGMRCIGEIDITKPRWSEDPTQLVPSLISNLRTAAAGEHRAKFKQGAREAEAAAAEIVAAFGGLAKRKVARLVSLYRNLMGMREHHKFTLIRLMAIYKDAILEEADALVRLGALRRREDVFYMTLEELILMLEHRFTGMVPDIVEARERQHERNQQLKSPRVMTSEGEIISGKRRDAKAPAGAIIGTPVSAGVVVGVARVILRPEDAKLNPGEILVAPYTDPGWTPLFTSIVGLVTEVGGMMTHGSVIAREYGLPAVVGIEKATEIIPDGAYIRLDGTNGFVELISANGP
ncbi:pyruvate, water dikinase [Paenibacillus sp. UNCCL117]|uniref:phosphoenolpyruvate synthase n=1 Tax=unclassified Paenibacillus TaxID=185978 RepID=UPI0008817BC5|nr:MULTISPECIES: phosphoenolpyruvate synthase [unclassified Paenibacillus]SDC44200.1 phosphoenolpyruvate synthase [Paenibacillus sp. cl123]SFW12790.1 pyruvate, water dikinase [Paenibacillus sp. UNCCL117]